MIPKELAKSYLSNNLAVLPASAIEKRPTTIGWKQYQFKLPTECEIDAWFSNPTDAICVLTGPASGNLECIDFDYHGEAFERWADFIAQPLMDKLVIESTPSGGYHVFYRCEDPVEGNQKLAMGVRNQATTTLIETRGTGGLVLIAPSVNYTLKQGSFENIPLLTADEHQCLLNAARACNEVVKTAPAPVCPIIDAGFTLRPGDDYNSRGDFNALLLKHGWNVVSQYQDNTYYRRPGKTIGQSASFNGKVFYVFSSNAYPFEPEVGYTPYQAYTLLEHDGNYTASAKALLELGYGVAADPTVGVDLSAIVNQTEPEQQNDLSASEKVQDPGPLPRELMDVPGFINELAGYTTRTAPHPNPVLSFVGALSMLSMLTGRKFCDISDARTNVFFIALANSGTGKDHPRKVNFKLATTLGMMDSVGDSFSSGEGLEDALYHSPSMLFMTDEFDCMLNNIKNRDARAESLNSAMLRLYGEANSVHCMRVKAKARGKEVDESTARRIYNPHFVLHGTAVPQYFYKALTSRILENGLIARCMVIEADQRGALQNISHESFPQLVLDAAAYFRDLELGTADYSKNVLQPICIPETPEAKIAFIDAYDHAETLGEIFEVEKDLMGMSVWRRAFEKERKLAMLSALSRSYDNPIIDECDVLWARKLVEYLSKKIIFMATAHVYETPFEEMIKRSLDAIRIAKGKLGHSQLLRKLKVDKDTFKKLIDTLIERGEIEREVVKTQTRTGVAYKMKQS